MFLTSILALTDFSVAGDNALARACQIARAHGADLQLMYAPVGRRGECLDPDARLMQTATALANQWGLTVRPVGTGNYSLDSILTQAEHANLLVLPQRSKRSLVALWLAGPEAIRVARHVRCPVLVTRGPIRQRSRQILVGVDFTPASHHRAVLACLLDRNAQVELFHAVNTTGENLLRRADLDGNVLRRYRDNCKDIARNQLARMTQLLSTPSMPVVSSAQLGQPAEQLIKRQGFSGADLVIVGKRRRHAATDYLLRSTAHELLAESNCDVMVVPDDFQVSPTRSLVQRLKMPMRKRQSGTQTGGC